MSGGGIAGSSHGRVVDRWRGRAAATAGGVWLALGWTGITGASEPVPPPHPAAYRLHWTAPADCPSAAEVEAAVAARLEGETSGHGTALITGAVTRWEGGFRLDLRTDFAGAVETRQLRASGCEELGAATALVVAVALRPSLAGELAAGESLPPLHDDGADSPEPEAASPEPRVGPSIAAPALAAEEPMAPAADAPQRRAWPRGLVEVGVGPEWGALAAATLAARLGVGVSWSRFSLKLHGLYLAPRTLRRANGSGGRYQLGATGLRGCGRVRRGRVTIPICGGMEGGVLRVDSRGLTPSVRRFGPWLGPLVSAGMRVQWGSLGLLVDAELVGRAIGSATTIDDQRRVEQFFLSSRLFVGAVLFFP